MIGGTMNGEPGHGHERRESVASDVVADDSRLASEVSDRVRDILDAAERQAESLRAEAREEARRHAEDARRRADELIAQRERRISQLSDALVARLETLLRGLEGAEEARAAFEDLVRALGDAAERIGRDASEPGEPSPQPGPLAGEQDALAAHTHEERDRRADGAHIVAIQMAAAGRTRADTESHIRDSLGIADPGPVLDEVFGPGTPGEATVPWAKPRPG
jgi:vacuolar-type H+-ATPase subunit H